MPTPQNERGSGKLDHGKMRDVLARGESVILGGQMITSAAGLPQRAELALAGQEDPGVVASDLDAEILRLQGQRALLNPPPSEGQGASAAGASGTPPATGGGPAWGPVAGSQGGIGASSTPNAADAAGVAGAASGLDQNAGAGAGQAGEQDGTGAGADEGAGEGTGTSETEQPAED